MRRWIAVGCCSVVPSAACGGRHRDREGAAHGPGMLVVPPDARLQPWRGRFQRVILAVWLPYMFTLALRLRRVSTQR